MKKTTTMILPLLVNRSLFSLVELIWNDPKSVSQQGDTTVFKVHVREKGGNKSDPLSKSGGRRQTDHLGNSFQS